NVHLHRSPEVGNAGPEGIHEIACFRDSSTARPDPVALYLLDLGDSSRRPQLQVLNVIARYLSGGELDAVAFQWHELDHATAARARSYVVDRYAPSTARRAMAALRAVLKRCKRLRLMSPEDYDTTADLDPVRGSRLPPGRGVTAGELGALFAACSRDPGPAGLRDAAALALLYAAGLRRSEAAGLTLEDLAPDLTAVRVTGKGNRQRQIPLAGGAQTIIRAWLEVRGAEPGPLLLALTAQRAMRSVGITPHAVYQLVLKRAEQAGVTAVRPHDLRRSFVGDLLDSGVDLAVVQRLCGHQQTDTTARYDRRGSAAMRTAVDHLFVPSLERRLEHG
ncbi:MAG TPA: tyrosine-type recombinase/integrase, partial [Thermoanaerobaculales bacterium]|nr:tyrosine-type recombinase/integrase [Thermoanaerobaculales bacterium]